MTENFKSTVIGVRGVDGRIAGTGFLFDRPGRRAFTCAHVLLAAQAGPGSVVELYLAAASGQTFTADVLSEGWNPPEGSNTAVLRIRETLPDGVATVKLGRSLNVQGLTLHSLGYPQRNELSMWAVGKMLPPVFLSTGLPLLQIQAQTLPTLSGAPLLDGQSNRVVGMITRPPAGLPNVRPDIAYATPAELLAQVGMAPLVPRERGKVVSDGLNALGDLLANPETRRSVYDQLARPGLSSAMYRRVAQALVASGYFDERQRLQTVFTDERIALWRDEVPDGSSPSARVDAVIAFLLERQNVQHQENGLVLLLRALTDRMPAEDLAHEQLATAAALLARELAGAGESGGEPAEPAGGAAIEPAADTSALDRQTVDDLRRDFVAASEHIDRVSYYKTIHDKLHTLQFQCFYLLQSESRYFPDERSIPLCRTYSRTLHSIVGELDEAGESAGQPLDWLDTLREADALVEEAIGGKDAQMMADALYILDAHILMRYPNEINNRLNEAARGLYLEKLIDSMERMRQALLQLSDNSHKLQEIQEGVEALMDISRRLLDLVEDHDEWQKADVELRMIEEIILRPADLRPAELNLFGLERRWTRLSQRTIPLYQDRPESWAVKLSEVGERLGQAITDHDHEQIRDSFDTYRWEAGDRFYKVDKELLTLCNELREAAAPLRNLLEKL